MTDTINAFEIARMVDVASPDAVDSPGGEWLEQVYGDAVELIADNDGDAYAVDDDDVADRADSIVPVYTHERWQVFVDLAAYTEDIAELGDVDPDDLTRSIAGVALYMIARRVYEAVVEEAQE